MKVLVVVEIFWYWYVAGVLFYLVKYFVVDVVGMKIDGVGDGNNIVDLVVVMSIGLEQGE